LSDVAAIACQIPAFEAPIKPFPSRPSKAGTGAAIQLTSVGNCLL